MRCPFKKINGKCVCTLNYISPDNPEKCGFKDTKEEDWKECEYYKRHIKHVETGEKEF